MKRTTRPNPFIIVKTAPAILCVLLFPITATQAQAPPALAPTNATATNIADGATNDIAARRRALQQSFTNRLSRMNTNQVAFPAIPAPAAATNAPPAVVTATPINPALGQPGANQALAGAPAPGQIGILFKNLIDRRVEELEENIAAVG